MAEAAEDRGGGVLLAVADGGSAHFSIPGRTCLLDLVKPDRHVRGLAGTLLADCYLVNDTAEAADAQTKHPHAQFVTRDGVVVGATFVRTPARHEARVEKLLRESASLERELGDVRRRLRANRHELVQVTGRLDLVRRRLEQVDEGITSAAEEAAEIKAEVASLAKEKELVGERLRTLLSTASNARSELVDEPEAGEAPAMPPRPEPPIHLRVEVESLRRERARLEAAVVRTRREVETLQADDPIALRGTLAELEAERAAREERLGTAEGELTADAEAHRVAVEAVREVRERDAEVNRGWREQAAEVDRIRESHEGEERVRLDLERRIVEVERLLRDGHGTDPEEAVRATRSARRCSDRPWRPRRARARPPRGRCCVLAEQPFHLDDAPLEVEAPALLVLVRFADPFDSAACSRQPRFPRRRARHLADGFHRDAVRLGVRGQLALGGSQPLFARRPLGLELGQRAAQRDGVVACRVSTSRRMRTTAASNRARSRRSDSTSTRRWIGGSGRGGRPAPRRPPARRPVRNARWTRWRAAFAAARRRVPSPSRATRSRP